MNDTTNLNSGSDDEVQFIASVKTTTSKTGRFILSEDDVKIIESGDWLTDHIIGAAHFVLGFISNESRRFHTYVANRVQLLHEHTTPSQWHYVETALNTADEGSRGMSPKDFVEKSEWIKGPDFLKEPVESWLKEETYEEHVDADSPKVKESKVNASAMKENSDVLKRLQRFSSWYKVKVAVALCLRNKKKLRGNVLAKKKAPSDGASEERSINGTSISPGLNVVDLEEAEVPIRNEKSSNHSNEIQER